MSDGLRGYGLALAAMRERAVRDGKLAPRYARECRQANEGPVKVEALDCLKPDPAEG